MVVVLVLVAVVQFVRYGQLQSEQTKLTRMVQEGQAEKARLQGIRTEVEKFQSQKDLLQKRINIIEDLKAKQAGPVKLLDLLASTVTKVESVYLTNFDQTGQRVTIEGFARDPKAVADFLTQLKGTNTFSEMDLKETFQDANSKETQKFLFTVNGELATPVKTPTT
jgi:Tfp pilus assembly protein PilN